MAYNTQRDKANLKFLMAADGEVLERWFNSTSTDDHDYALELLRDMNTKLAMIRLGMTDEVVDVDLAKVELARIMK